MSKRMSLLTINVFEAFSVQPELKIGSAYITANHYYIGEFRQFQDFPKLGFYLPILTVILKVTDPFN